MTDPEQWQLDASAPELYEKYLVPRITLLWARDLISRASPKPGERVLDLACGTGAVARLVAENWPTAKVVGLDLNDGMLAVARSVGKRTIEWRQGSALDLPFDDGAFDLLYCQLGLQFFPDRAAALSEMRRVLSPGGRMAVSVYSAIENTPAAHAFANALDKVFGDGASSIKRSEHAFSDRGELASLAAEAGFSEIAVEAATQTINFPSAREYVRIQLAATPMAKFLAGMSSEGKEAAVQSVTAQVEASLPPSMLTAGLTFPQESYVLLARC